MTRPWHKPALAASALALLLVGAAAIALQALVDPEALKQLAREKVRAAWNRDLAIGDLRLDLLPLPSLHATRVAIANARWAKAPNVLEVDQLDANLELVPLLVGRVRIKSLSLAGVKAALEEADDGAVSWPEGGDRPGAAGAGGDEGGVRIGEIRIRDVVVHRRRGSVDEAPWRIEEAVAEVGPGLEDVRVEAKVWRHDRPLAVKARFADLSRLGARGAVTDGRVELAWKETTLVASGKLPLERHLEGHDLRVEAKSASLQDVFEFMGFDRGRTAAFALQLASRGTQRGAEVTGLRASLGELQVDGAITLMPEGDRTRLDGQLHATRLDWLKALADAGGRIKPPRHDGQVFHEDPVAWHALSMLAALRARLGLRVDGLRMGNGLELRDFEARLASGDGKLELAPFSAAMLGGTATGSVRIDAPRKAMKVTLEGDKLLLEEWFRQRGSKIPFEGGPMQVKAALAFGGETFRDLAASVSGTLSVRMGAGTWRSPHAGEVEGLMVDLPNKEEKPIRFECAAAHLVFDKGRASGRRLVGARSDTSILLTSGAVDLREEKLDLRGRVQARNGIPVGLAAFAGGVQITGRLARPRMRMDPGEKPALVARAAAAVATMGATIVGEALLNAAAREDPCGAVFK